MKNGAKQTVDLEPLAELLRANNAFQLEQLAHLIAIRANLETAMIYLPACASGAEVSKASVDRIIRASHRTENSLLRKTREALKKFL